MADKADKTEEATPKQIQKAREEGNVPKSMDMNSSLVLLTGATIIAFWGKNIGNALRRLMEESFRAIPDFVAMPGKLHYFVMQGFKYYLLLLAPFFIAILIVGITSNVTQFGFLMTGKAIQPKFSKVFSMKGLAKLVSKNSFIELLKSIAKMIVVGVIGYMVVKGHFMEYLELADQGLYEIASLIFRVSVEILLKCAIVLLFLGFIDLAYQRHKYRRELRMSKQEVKDEARNTDGDPHIKGKIKNLRAQMHRNLMMQEIPKATVVITNPTFIAIALRYEQGVDRAPMVLGKGKRLIAERIRDLARENGIPIVEDKPLARSLFDVAEIGEQIPEEFFGAVAEVLAYVYSLDNRSVRSAV